MLGFIPNVSIIPVPAKELEDLYAAFHTTFVLIASSLEEDLFWLLIMCVVGRLSPKEDIY